MKEIKKGRNRVYFYYGIKYISKYNSLKIILCNSDNINYQSIDEILLKENNKDVEILNVSSIKVLNKLIDSLHNINYDGNISINLKYSENKDMIANVINGLTNKSFIKINMMQDFVKLKGYFKDNIQTEFTTWGHNLDDETKKKFVLSLSSDDKEIFNKEELLIKKFYESIMKKYPDIDSKNDKDKYDLLYSEINKRCENKDRLGDMTTLLLNNSLFNLNVTNIRGYKNGRKHVWNVLIYDDQNIYSYDLIDNEKFNRYIPLRTYPVLDELKKSRVDTKKSKKIANLALKISYRHI